MAWQTESKQGSDITLWNRTDTDSNTKYMNINQTITLFGGGGFHGRYGVVVVRRLVLWSSPWNCCVVRGVGGWFELHGSRFPLGKETCYQAPRSRLDQPPPHPHNTALSRRRSENKPPHDYNAIPAKKPPHPPNSVIVLFIFMHFVLLSVSVLFHSVLSDSCFDSVCQAMRM